MLTRTTVTSLTLSRNQKKAWNHASMDNPDWCVVSYDLDTDKYYKVYVGKPFPCKHSSFSTRWKQESHDLLRPCWQTGCAWVTLRGNRTHQWSHHHQDDLIMRTGQEYPDVYSGKFSESWSRIVHALETYCITEEQLYQTERWGQRVARTLRIRRPQTAHIEMFILPLDRSHGTR